MKNKKLYNYLVNTFGLSKEIIMKHVEKRIEDIIDKNINNLLNSNKIHDMIVSRVSEYIKKGTMNTHLLERKSFETIINEQIRAVVENYLRERFKITMQFKDNCIKFMEN